MVGHYPAAGTRLAARFWLIAAAALIAVSATLSLALWQMSRAAQKQSLQQEAQDRAKLPPLDSQAVAQLRPGDTQSTYRRVVLHGHWLHRSTVYLDNRQMDGKQGFFVLTPLQLANAEHTVLMVQRGWAQRNFENRTALPVLGHPDGDVVVEGQIAPPPAKLYEFQGIVEGNIRQNLDLAGFALETGLPLPSFSVLQTGPASDGLLRDWPPIDTGVDMHHGYAFQWFALSGLIVFLFVWFQIVRRFFYIR